MKHFHNKIRIFSSLFSLGNASKLNSTEPTPDLQVWKPKFEEIQHALLTD
jgi:hypothetical protein